MADTKKNQQKLFNNEDVDTQRSTFKLGYKNKMTANFNKIIPSALIEVMPGDSVHAKTSFFSRWLTLKAPVFSEYEIKINNFHVSNNMLWRGWSQFMGNGDDQSSDYLLPTGAVPDMKVPYFTSKDFAKMFFNRFVHHTTTNWLGIYIDEGCPYELVFARVPGANVGSDFMGGLRRNATQSNMSQCYAAYTDPSKFDTAVILLWMPKNDVTQDLIERGVVYPVKTIIEKDTNSYFQWDHWYDTCNYCVYPSGAILPDNDTDYAFIEIDPDCKPFSQEIDGVFAPGATQAVIAKEFTEATNVANIDTKNFSQFVFYHQYWEKGTSVPVVKDSPLMLYGYTLMAINIDAAPRYTGSGDIASLKKLSLMDVWMRIHGQYIVKKYLGTGTLADYLGLPFEMELLRQPFELADYLLNPTQHTWEGFVKPERYTTALGTYNENSQTYTIGVVNEEPISILPFLAYHAAWSTLMRDPRYELRSVWFDPYKSPFQQVLPNGRYIDGNIFGNLTFDIDTSYSETQRVFNSPLSPLFHSYNNTDWRSGVSNQNVFAGYASLLDIIALKDRRVVQDRFTLLSPRPQYGDDIVVANTVSSDGPITLGNSIYGAKAPLYSDDNSTFTENGVLTASISGQTKQLTYSGGLASTLSVQALRLATRLQKFMERNNIVGSDYVKQILAHYGVSPESCNHCAVRYLGGDKFTPTVSPVEMTSSNSADTGQTTGQQSANMYGSGRTNDVNFQVDEHGYYLQVLTIQNDYITTQGLPKQSIDKYDFAFPEFANLGAEAVPLKRLIFTDGTVNTSGVDYNPNLSFGYQPRYADLKCSLDQIHADFRKGQLSYWVTPRRFNPSLLQGSFGLGRKENIPELGANFLYENANYEAFTYSKDDYDHCLLDMEHDITVSRLLPVLPSPNVL